MKTIIFSFFVVLALTGCTNLDSPTNKKMVGAPKDKFPIIDALNNAISLIEAKEECKVSVLAIYKATEQLVNGMNYNFIFKLQKISKANEVSEGFYEAVYYTGPFPLKEENKKLTVFKTIAEEDIVQDPEASEQMVGAPKGKFQIIEALNKVLELLNTKEFPNLGTNIGINKILSATEQLVNGLRYKFIINLYRTLEDSQVNKFFIDFYTGPFSSPSPSIKSLVNLDQTLSEIDGEIEEANKAVDQYISLYAGDDDAQYKLGNVQKTWANEDQSLIKLKAVAMGVNVNCVECRLFWVQGKQVIYSEVTSFE